MAHRPLKYRPQVFADMVGQDHVSLVLARALEGHRIAHAFLFTGARGVGKTTSARILAKALNCERRASGELKGADPCNTCNSCLEITSGVSLDVAEIDGASNRGIADVQALREKVRFSPTGGRYRVVIIDEVHQLSNDAFAALLKTLEEPPPHLVFIFATTDPQKLPDTIRSRTQRFDFARVPIRKVADRLLEIARREAADPEGVKFTLSEGAAILIAQKSEGAMRDAVSALDQVISAGEADVNEELVRRVLGIADREAFFALADAITRRDPKETLHRLHEAFAKGLDARDLAEGLSEHIRHILILKVDPDGQDLVPATRDELERLREQGRDWPENDLLRLLRIASESLLPMKDSPQPLVHLEAAVLQMATLEPGETLAELLKRLEQLERRLAAGTQPSGGSTGGLRAPSAPAPGVRPGPARPGPTAADRPAPTMPRGPRAYEPNPATAEVSSSPPAAQAPPQPAQALPPTASASSAPMAQAPARSEAATSFATRPLAPVRAGVALADTAAALGEDEASATATATLPPPPSSVAVMPAPAPPRASVAPAPLPPRPSNAAVTPSPAPPRPAGVVPSPARRAAPSVAVPLDPASFVLDERTERCWREVLAAINTRKRILGAFLEESRFLGVSESSAALATDDLHRAVIEEVENRKLLGEELRRAFGQPLALVCGMPVAHAEPASAPESETVDVKSMIERTIAWFDGEAIAPAEPRPERPVPRWKEKSGR